MWMIVNDRDMTKQGTDAVMALYAGTIHAMKNVVVGQSMMLQRKNAARDILF
jgi:hypothetical protein